ncbi:MAG: HEAT repeat domain-containing protein [Planctomycetota bacterium]|jgi:hypothetical protein
MQRTLAPSAQPLLSALSTVLPLALAMLAGGCASNDAAPEQPKGYVALKDLDLAKREALEAFQLGGDAWDQTLASARSNPELSRFLVDNLARQLSRAFAGGSGVDLARPDGSFNRARSGLIALGEPTCELARQMVADGDDVIAYLGGDLLAALGESGCGNLLALLSDRREQVRRRAAESLGLVPAPISDDVLDALAERCRDDESWVVRAQSAQALGRLAYQVPERDDLLVTLAAVSRDDDLSVAAEAAAGMARCGDDRATPHLIALYQRGLDAGHPAAAQAGRGALEALHGRSLRGPAEWWEWWNARARAGSGS